MPTATATAGSTSGHTPNRRSCVNSMFCATSARNMKSAYFSSLFMFALENISLRLMFKSTPPLQSSLSRTPARACQSCTRGLMMPYSICPPASVCMLLMVPMRSPPECAARAGGQHLVADEDLRALREIGQLCLLFSSSGRIRPPTCPTSRTSRRKRRRSYPRRLSC